MFLIVDDLRTELGFANEQENLKAVSPNIDALANKSLVFDRAYVQQGVCSPSRNSFLSGRRPDTTQVWNFQISFRQTLGTINVTSWPQAFKDAGWMVNGMGKVRAPCLLCL